MPTAHDVAALIIELDPTVDNMKLNKELYFTQAACLAWAGSVAFSEEIQAWRWGPVVPPVYDTYSDLGSNPIGTPRGGRPERLTEQVREFVREVVESYRGLSSMAVMDVSHMTDTPWNEARRDVPADKESRNPIPAESMRQYYRRLTPLRPPQLTGRDRELAGRIANGEDAALSEILHDYFPDAQITSVD